VLISAALTLALQVDPLAHNTRAGPYTFTNIADSDGDFGFTFGAPSINSAGTAAFITNLDNGDIGVFSGNGGATTIALVSGPFASLGFGDNPTINTAGTVAFRGILDAGNDDGIFTGAGGATTTIHLASEPDLSSFLTNPVINDAGLVVFKAGRDGGFFGIFTDSDNTPLDTIALSGSTETYSNLGDTPSINASGEVAFQATRRAGNVRGIFTSGDGGTTIALAGPGGFADFSNPAINSVGTVAFRADLVAGGSGIFTGSGGPMTTTVATTAGPFSGFGDPSINAAGFAGAESVAFFALLDNNESGIFVGPDPDEDMVIVTGDPLFGSTLSLARLGINALNDDGEVAFFYELVNGRRGIAVATPLVLSADFDGDGDVDSDDLDILKMNYGKTSGATREEGDLDGDGDVDGHDFLRFQRRLEPPPPLQPASAAAPEPNSSILAACVIISASVCLRRWRQ
jgi:hypothetical protein